MKTRMMMVLIGIFCFAAAASAQQAAKPEDFWSKLQNRLEKVVPAKKSATTTAVGGVRGARNDDANDLYWKGKEKPFEVDETELQKFNLGIEARQKGDQALALTYFEAFLKEYPQSNLRLDGLQAVETLKMEMAAAKNPGGTSPVP